MEARKVGACFFNMSISIACSAVFNHNALFSSSWVANLVLSPSGVYFNRRRYSIPSEIPGSHATSAIVFELTSLNLTAFFLNSASYFLRASDMISPLPPYAGRFQRRLIWIGDRGKPVCGQHSLWDWPLPLTNHGRRGSLSTAWVEIFRIFPA